MWILIVSQWNTVSRGLHQNKRGGDYPILHDLENLNLWYFSLNLNKDYNKNLPDTSKSLYQFKRPMLWKPRSESKSGPPSPATSKYFPSLSQEECVGLFLQGYWWSQGQNKLLEWVKLLTKKLTIPMRKTTNQWQKIPKTK